MTMELDIKEILSELWNKAWIIALCACVLGGLFLGYTTLFITPLYRSDVTMYVNNSKNTIGSDSISASDLATAQQLVRTCVIILTSDRVLEKVAEKTELDISPSAIRSMISAGAVDETEVFRVVVTCPDPEVAAKIANAIASVAPSEIASIRKGSSVEIIDLAKIATSPSYPSNLSNTMIGALIGALLAAVAIVLRMLLDTRIKTEEQLTKLADLPILGRIPEFSANKGGK